MNRLPDMDQRDLDGDITPADETRFPCSCGDERCYGYDDDPQNVNLNGVWYAADCDMGRRLQAIAFGREMASRADVARDDSFEQTRR